ncbi:response regulator [Undibacterium oligocarboniphilum]|uniref:Response regulator transcription factor n=1 Tax=Undibacterium oligocarboniphilum TaxID=666702 RepID=A0A850QGX1_9BURK|nr:response regulator transcription factor [Undibacterium oligocarboniphilum]MBC3870388.1 response regulator transcription factor [Undibacterium oligocarboniphilum]NVO78379.1 response regulator transcription factor [Undibacterium oligocarboniphilum]
MNLYIVEDSVLIQNRLIRFVEEIPGMYVVGVSGDVDSAYNGVINSETDAIILDLQLGTGNGLQLLKEIKQHKPEIKIVILTNHSTEDNRLHALRAGADDFLDKSTDFEQIQNILHSWQQPLAPHRIN